MKTILFDFFGVISTPMFKPIIEEFVPASRRIEFMNDLNELDLGDMSERELVRKIALASGISPEDIAQKAAGTPRLNTRLLALIEHDLRPILHVGLLTNAQRVIIKRIMADKLALFDPLLISSDLQLIKPGERIFLAAIQRCGNRARDILFVDDSVVNVEVARRCGMCAVLYRDVPQLISELREYDIDI